MEPSRTVRVKHFRCASEVLLLFPLLIGALLSCIVAASPYIYKSAFVAAQACYKQTEHGISMPNPVAMESP